MSKRQHLSIRARLRKRLARFRMKPVSKHESAPKPSPIDSQNTAKNQTENISEWSKQTTFRSSLTVNGSPLVKVWFESVDEIGIRFTLNLANGLMSQRENWTPDIQMPGESSIDPEPLSVWGIESQDGRIHIIMHVDAFDALYVDDIMVKLDDHPEVAALLTALTNVAVRDIWIEP